MMNYLFDVRFDDPGRFKLIFEQAKGSHSQSQSQTDEIKGYVLDPPKLNHGVILVDTPGR